MTRTNKIMEMTDTISDLISEFEPICIMIIRRRHGHAFSRFLKTQGHGSLDCLL